MKKYATVKSSWEKRLSDGDDFEMKSDFRFYFVLCVFGGNFWMSYGLHD